jgi:drug/metabolite transporter (DMT)-like permease
MKSNPRSDRGHTPHTGRGVAFGAAAGAAWGLVFLAPELVPMFSPLQLSAGRYLAYGLIAAALVLPRWRAVTAQLGRAEWRALFWLSILGNILYYVLLATAVQQGGMAMTSLVIGFLPVAVTVIGSRGQGAIPLQRLAWSLLLGVAGIGCIAWQSLTSASDAPLGPRVLGLVCALGALVSWTGYAVSNSRWLSRLSQVSAHDWSLLTGVVTGAQALVLAVPAFWLLPSSAAPHESAEWLRFVGVSAGVALVASVLGNACWNKASRLLPLTLVGQMIVFETLFALLYGFIWETRWPTGLEAAAMVLITSAVLSCISAHQPAPTSVADEVHP